MGKKLSNHGKKVNISQILAKLSDRDLKLIAEIRSQKITYLSETRLASINTTCCAIEDANLAGLFIEAGCWGQYYS